MPSRLPRAGRSPLIAGALLLLGLGASACDRGPDVIQLFYRDELVEAPTRTVDLLAVRGADCDAVQRQPHEALAESADKVTRFYGKYPLSPETDPFVGLERDGQGFLLDVVGYDSSLLQISRGCAPVTLGPDPLDLHLELRALPGCVNNPTSLDVMIVLDTSLNMAVSDPERIHLDALIDTLLDPTSVKPGTSWGIVTFGHNNQETELLQATTELDRVKNAIESVRNVEQGQPHLFDGVSKAASLLRARALCGRRPVMVVIAGDADIGSQRPLEEAEIGLFATREDLTDDIYTFAMALNDEGYTDLRDLVPEMAGTVSGAANGAQMRAMLREVRVKLIELLR